MSVPPPRRDREVEGALAAAEHELERLRGDLAEARREAEVHRLELEAARQETAAFAEATLRDAERELVQLATAVAERVIAREVDAAPELIVGWAREALAGSNLGDSLVIAASSDLEARISSEAWGELAPRVVTDASLPDTTCELRARGTVITVSSAERLELVTAHVAATSEREAA
jgi:flagellar biosynthesis/type III secretory pathway protein FliH